MLVIFLIGLISGVFFWETKVPIIKANLKEIVYQVKQARLDRDQWDEIFVQTRDLPSIYPVSNAKNSILEMENVFIILNEIQKFPQRILSDKVSSKDLLTQFEYIQNLDESLGRVQNNVQGIPDFMLDDKEEEQREKVLKEIAHGRWILADIMKFGKVCEEFIKNKERVLVLLQNQNEPRSTGGFSGSMVVIDFNEDEITWNFQDIYAVDRLIADADKPPAPEFFHNLSKNISLRDANFWPDFAQSAGKYRYFFGKTEYKVPNTVVAINLNIVKEALKLTDPVELPKWGVQFNEYNFDLVLQFLVESKIAGRYGVKDPVFEFAGALGAQLKEEVLSIKDLLKIDWEGFWKGKNLLANSQDETLQALFEKWKIDGQMIRDKNSDNFIHFDFVSIGANKSEKFVWTDIWHDSLVARDGRVRNKLEITRNHALRAGEIDDLLRTNFLSENVKSLLNPDLLWKLGAGQNRTMLRVWVPRDSDLISFDDPAGEVKEEISEDNLFKIFLVPMNVTPGEKLKVNLIYETKINRGIYSKRPYFLQLMGTPARDKTKFLSTISTEINGRFIAETNNIGLPQTLTDSNFRTVVEFDF